MTIDQSEGNALNFHEAKMTSYTENWNSTVVMAYDEGFPLLMPRWGYVASAFALFLIGFFGFFLNLMVILLMFKDRQLWTPLNIILFNLVCSDFSVSVLGNPFTLISALFHRWVFGHTMCVMYGFFMALLGITSITTLTVLSFERYMLVTRPLSSRHLTSRGAILSIVFIWIYSLALTTPPLMGWGNYVNEAANISCSVNWHEQSMNTLTYILFLFAMGQVVPLAIITYSYVNIVRTMKKNSQRLGRVSRAEDKVTAMVFVMIIAFTVAWTPYSVFALMEQFATEGIVSPGAGVIPALVAKSSICYDPLIYVGMNTQFRQSIKRLFGVHNKGQHHSQTEKGYDNTLMSPAHKLSGVNDTRFNSDSNVSIIIKKQNKRTFILDETSEVTNNDVNVPLPRITEMCTIQENKTSDAERSGDTIFDDDSNNSGPKINTYISPKENSLTQATIDTDHLVLTEKYDHKHNIEGQNIVKNVYGNDAYEDHTTDETNLNDIRKERQFTRKNYMKHSYSLDLSDGLKQNQKRKLSIETILENFRQPSGILRNAVISKFFDQDCKHGQEIFKSYLCDVDTNDIIDNTNL